MHSHVGRFSGLGVIALQELLDGDTTARQARRLLAEHGYVREQRGIYQRPGEPTAKARWEQSLAAVLLIAGPNGVASRQSAAAVLNLDGFEPGKVLVQVDVPRTEQPRDPRIRRRTHVADHRTVGLFPATTAAETLVDLGTGLEGRYATRRRIQFLRPDELVELALEYALRHRLTSIEELTDLVDAPGASQQGAAVLKLVLKRRPPGAPPTESYLETRGVQVLRNGGLPDFERQEEVLYDGVKMRLDLARGLAVIEFDGREPHEPLFVEDRRRWNLIDEAGYHLRVFTFEDVEHDPRLVVTRARRLLALAA